MHESVRLTPASYVETGAGSVLRVHIMTHQPTAACGKERTSLRSFKTTGGRTMASVAKASVLSSVNQVLLKSGLNDTVWSIRDCDSTLFVLMYKKLVGKVQPQPPIAPAIHLSARMMHTLTQTSPPRLRLHRLCLAAFPRVEPCGACAHLTHIRVHARLRAAAGHPHFAHLAR